jgi:hypothetical protein
MSIIQGTAKGGGTVAASFYDYPIEQSLRFDGSSYLSFTPPSNTNSGLWTYSVWVKLSGSDFSGLLLGASPSSFQSDLRFGGTLQFFDDAGSNFNLESSMLFRDTSAFYHIVVAVNSSLSTDKIKIYVNGSVISFSVNSQSFTTSKYNNSSYDMRIGGRSSSSVTLNGYLANIQLIDGQALDPYFFGELKDNIWVPYNAFSTAGSGTATASDGDTATDSYGTNGFHLDFADSSNIGNDVSGNNNDWTVN